MNLWERYLSLSEEERDKVDEQEGGGRKFFQELYACDNGAYSRKGEKEVEKKRGAPIST